MIVFAIMLCSQLSGMRLKAFQIFILDSITKARAEIIQKQNYFPLSAFTWNKKPPQPVKGILGENVTLEWTFSLASANERFDYFLLLRSGDDVIKYSDDVGKVTYTKFIGSVEMAKNGTPAFTLINLQQKDDNAEFCCKVGTKRTGASHGDVHKDCVTLKLLGKT